MITPDERLTPHLDAPARRRLDDLLQKVRADPATISTLFPAAARLVARGPADPADPAGSGDPGGILSARLEDEARVALLAELSAAWRDRPGALTGELAELYRFGDADEKRAVLQALSVLDPGPDSLPLVEDALRTNDVRLVAAAVGPCGARYLSPDAWRQAVLKCLFVGVPLTAVAGLDERADGELARMVADYCDERAAAGRSLPPDADLVLGREVD